MANPKLYYWYNIKIIYEIFFGAISTKTKYMLRLLVYQIIFPYNNFIVSL